MCNEGARSPTRANVRYPMKYSHTLPAVGKSAAFEKDGLEIFTGKFFKYITKKRKHLEDGVVVRIRGIRARTEGNSSTMDSE